MEMSEAKQRNGCLTAWLFLLMVGNSMVVVISLIASAAIGQSFFSAPRWMYPVLTVGAIANVVCAYALFQWKKWGFFGFIATAALTITVNLINGASITQALLGLVGVAVLFVVLHIGKENKGWTQLE